MKALYALILGHIMIRLVNWTEGGVAVFADSEESYLITGLSDTDTRALARDAGVRATISAVNHKLQETHE